MKLLCEISVGYGIDAFCERVYSAFLRFCRQDDQDRLEIDLVKFSRSPAGRQSVIYS